MDLNLLRNRALRGNVPIIKPLVEDYLSSYLNKTKPINVVEIGTAIGYSSLFIADIIGDWNGNLTTFEISYPSYTEALNNFYNFQQFNITAYNIDPLQIDLKKIFTKKIDFLFIDAVMKLYLDFYLNFMDLLENNSIVILDNVVKFKSKSQSLYQFLNKNQIEYKIYRTSEDDGIMIFTHKSL